MRSPALVPLLLRSDRPSRLAGVLAALGGVALATAAVYPLKQVTPVVSLGVLYVLAVVVVSTFWGLYLGIATSILSAAAFNFFHLPPHGRFDLTDERDWVALLVFVVVAIATGSIAELARARSRESAQRRDEADLAAEMAQPAALRRSDELKPAVLRSVSHDLRTPLTAIMMAATALDATRPTSANVSEVREQVLDAATRLGRLIEKLLDLSVLQAGGVEPRLVWYSIDEVLAEAVEQLGASDVDFKLSVA